MNKQIIATMMTGNNNKVNQKVGDVNNDKGFKASLCCGQDLNTQSEY